MLRKFNELRKSFCLLMLLLGNLLIAHSATAGAIFVIGSDAIGLHGDSNFINPVINQLAAGDPSKPVLYLNDIGRTSVNYTAGTATIDFESYGFLTTADLSNYSGVYVDSPSSCCSDAGSSMNPADSTKLASFVAAGGSLGIGDYQGHSFWDTALGFSGAPSIIQSGTCVDPGISTASGIAFGFAPSYSEGCFVHQEYDPAFWAAHGYFALQVTDSGNWVTMASGFVEPGTSVPEPATLGLLGAGLLGLIRSRRKAA
jgi:hypothetical protein